jgi:hypothetical protein
MSTTEEEKKQRRQHIINILLVILGSLVAFLILYTGYNYISKPAMIIPQYKFTFMG